MTVCGIDQSFTNTAIIIFDLNTEEILDLKVFKTVKRSGTLEHSPEERILAIKDLVIDIILEYDCSLIFIEGLSLNSNSRTMRDLAGLYYVLLTSFLSIGVPSVSFPPLSVKAFAKRGNSSKEELFDVICDKDKEIIVSTNAKKTTGLYDLSDAYHIGKLGIYRYKNDQLVI